MEGEYEVEIDLATASPDELGAFLIDGARYDDEEDVTMALKHGAPVNAADASGRTALHMAAANGAVGIARQLLDAGADPMARNESGNTPLHYACLNGQPQAVRLLLDFGAEPTALNAAERTPVDECIGRAGKGHRQCMEVIREVVKASREEEAAAAEAPEEEMEEEVIEMGSEGKPANEEGDSASASGVEPSGSGAVREVEEGMAEASIT